MIPENKTHKHIRVQKEKAKLESLIEDIQIITAEAMEKNRDECYNSILSSLKKRYHEVTGEEYKWKLKQ
ncbi:MAG TPA: hypothetical protein VGA29_02575 [Ignavibacteriaceae bacterium]